MPRTLHDTARLFLPTLQRLAPTATLEDAETLVRAERALHRWSEQECGDSNDYASWCITRDETTGRTYRETSYHHGGRNVLTPIPDRETAALRRVAATCTRLGLSYHHQTDPRGVALYVSTEPIDDVTYSSRGRAVAA